ncbi:hypothetical protein [Tenacibaculum sp.]|uniref:hypothetical protein n=1 Tax=Tenacibaculum sp. TaxID=1906242 RepID=UPI003AA8089B
MKSITLQIVILILLTSCSTLANKEKLTEQLIDMRVIPNNLVTVTKINDYEIAYQDKSTYSDRYNYPNNYAIGKVNTQKNDYEYITHVNGISPIEEFEYVTTILEAFKTDSTYVGVIIKEKDSVKANIYRKIKKSKPRFVMWKWVKAPYGTITFETVELTNEHWFEN